MKLDFIFRTNLFLSNDNVENISLLITFKNCEQYDISNLSLLKNKVLQCDLKSLPDHIYSTIDNKDYIICIEVLSEMWGFYKEYQPQNISVISKDNLPKGIMINDTAEVYNINNIPQNIKSKLIEILCGTCEPPNHIENTILPSNKPTPAPTPTNIAPPPPPTKNRSSLNMSPQFNDIYQETIKQMDNIKPSDDLLNEVQHIGGNDWSKIKTQINEIKGDSDASTT